MPAAPERRGAAGALAVVLSLLLFLGVSGFVTYRLNLVQPWTDLVDRWTGQETGGRTSAGADGSDDATDDGNGSATAEAGTASGDFGLPEGFDIGDPAQNGTSTENGGASAYTADNPFFDPAVDRTVLDKDLKRIEQAFDDADVETVKASILPGVQEAMMHAFEANADRLPEVAELLKTRRPVFVTDAYAEYEVTDGDKTYFAIFQHTSNGWVLVSL